MHLPRRNPQSVATCLWLYGTRTQFPSPQDRRSDSCVRGGLDRAGWNAPLAYSLRGLTAAQALWRPAAGLYNIWELVNHITVWKEEAARWLRGLPRNEELFKVEALGWPPARTPPACNNETKSGATGAGADDKTLEAQWQQTVARLRAAQEDLTAALEGTDVTPVEPGSKHPLPPGLGFAAGTPGHDCYHVAQINLIRKLQGSWPPPNPTEGK